MEPLRGMDNRSLIIGLLLGISLVLAISLGVLGYHQTALSTRSTEDGGKDNLTASLPSPSEMPGYLEQVRLKQQLEQTLEQKVQSLLDDIIGKDRSTVRIHATLASSREGVPVQTVSSGEHGAVIEEAIHEQALSSQVPQVPARNSDDSRIVQSITPPVKVQRLNIALGINHTQVVYNPHDGNYIEELRNPEEIDRLSQLTRQAAGFDEQRGDQIAVYPMHFDKTLDIARQLREQQTARKRFWNNAALTVGILALLLFLRWLLKRDAFSEIRECINTPLNKIALLVSAGVFLCANGLGFWGNSLSWREIGLLPGLFFLIVGGSKLFQVFRSESGHQDQEIS